MRYEKFTSTTMKNAITEHPYESRKEWILGLMERAGKKNGNNNDWSQKRYRIKIYSSKATAKFTKYIPPWPIILYPPLLYSF